MWDENEYSIAPNINKVMVIVDTNHDGDEDRDDRHIQSPTFYTHFSMLKSLEASFGKARAPYNRDVFLPTMLLLLG